MPTSVKLDAALKDRIQTLAKTRQRSAHWIIREAIAEYLTREEKREALRRDALAAWATYQQTGRHLTADEADTWLRRLADGEDAAPPECHG